ncbi:MAG TPA: M1 family aminopeptidase, partial [Kofleriaceae bacterium]|nr:M1 family aminopeptidase [Kofleriaceae bacterium]
MRAMRCALGATLFVLACGSSKPTPAPTVSGPPPKAGPAADGLSPPQPTVRLPRNFVPTHYELALAIDPAKPKFEGTTAITGTISERSRVIWLHAFQLDVTRAVARLGATEVALTATPKGEDLLELRAAQPLTPGEWTIELAYTGALDPVNTTGVFKQTVENQTYVFTQLEAIFARRVFPSFDEPGVKTPFKLSLRVPKALTAVANTPVVKETPAGDSKVVEFAMSKPMPTYLVAFGIGPFDIVDAGKSRRGTPMRIVTLAGRSADATYAAQTAGKVLDTVEDYFGVPYPYEKLDHLTIPLTVGFGAMENAGLITYAEDVMLMDAKRPSQAQREDWLGTAAHEVAHQWFGNFVTPMFWDDIWLNEGFATWLGTKVTAQLEPAWNVDALRLREIALESDAIVSARKIRQPIDEVDDIRTAFDFITYLKGASVLYMFEAYLGPDVFQKGVREYMATRAWGNATSADFVATISKASGKSIDAAFATFLDQAGAPELTTTTSCSGGKVELAVSQRRYLPPGAAEPTANTPWMLPVCMAFDKGGKRADTCFVLDKPQMTIPLDTKACPRWVMPNTNGKGYYRSAYTVAQITALRDEAWAKLTWPERRTLHFDVRTAAATGRLPLQLALSFTPKLLAGNDRHTIAAALALPTGFYSIVPDELRGKYEAWLRTQFGAAANQAGWISKETDTLDVEESREDLLDTVAWMAREPRLVAEAVRLADNWRALPEAIRGTVLAIAVDAKPEIFERTLREVAAEPDRAKRNAMFDALGSVRDPARYKAALALMLDPNIDVREATPLVFEATTDATREIAKQYMKTNLAAVLARMPSAQVTDPIARFAKVFTASCRADQRDAIADYVTKTFVPMPGGERVVKQAIERMDQCIAKRKALDGELRAWLGGIRTPKK